MSSSPKRQATLVAFYGAKSAVLKELIRRCWEMIAAAPRSDFLPYDMDQIHATIVGLECTAGSALRNQNLYSYRNKVLSMDLPGFRNYLLGGPHLPFYVQMGGFADRDYPFTSRGLRPYKRSFSVQGDKAVVMGWPIRGRPLEEAPTTPSGAIQEAGLYPDTLHRVRLSAEAFNILHSYHRDPSDRDNDFYLRIGLINRKRLGELTRQKLEKGVCQVLANSRPLLLEVGLPDLFIVSYEDETLPVGSTRAWSITDSRLTGDFLRNLYG